MPTRHKEEIFIKISFYPIKLYALMTKLYINFP